jgi:hypothetical protein
VTPVRLARKGLLLAQIAATALLPACSSIGPRSIRQDQVDYSDAIADAAKRQILLNIVKFRYGDYPTFLTVNQLVAGYQAQVSGSLGANLLPDQSFSLDEDLAVGASGSFSDNPTITYEPLRGRDFVRVLLAPLSPADLFGMLLTGVPAHLVLGVGLRSIGMWNNRITGAAGETEPDPTFLELVGIIGRLADGGRLGVSLEAQPSTEPNGAARRVVLTLVEGRDQDRLARDQRRLRELLGLPPGASEIEVAYGIGARRGQTIGVRTRSLMEVLNEMAAAVEVPAASVERGRAEPRDLALRGPRGPVRIRSALLEPVGAFVRVQYDGEWYWIDADDLGSKRVFSFVMLLFSLAQSSRPGQLPVLTIPTG